LLGIISLGDANAYLLSTAEENLGVIAARSVAGKFDCEIIEKNSEILFLGEKLVPISDCQMICPMTNIPEPRKVAKIQGDLTDEISKLV
jgi:exosome complex component CSL4